MLSVKIVSCLIRLRRRVSYNLEKHFIKPENSHGANKIGLFTKSSILIYTKKRIPSVGIGLEEEKNQMRIVIDGRYINDNFPGIGRYTYNLIRALGLLDTGDEFIILINSKLSNRRFDINAIGDLPGCHLVDCGVSRFLPAELLQLPKVIRRLRPSVYHSPFFLLPYPIPCPTIVSLHDLIPLKYPQSVNGFTSRITSWIGIRLACRLSAIIVTPSTSSAKTICEWGAHLKKRIYIIPDAPDPHFHPRPSNEIEGMRKKLGLRGPYILYVGTHLPHKNLNQLILAWAHLQKTAQRRKHPHRLIIAGRQNPQFPEAYELVEKIGFESSIRFIGAVDEEDLPALYSGADLFVFPSKLEGFGLPVIEAMACCTPVICSDIQSLREITGDAAWMIDPENTFSLANAIDKLLSDPQLRHFLAEKGLARSSDFTWKATADATYRLYCRAALK